MNKFVTLGLALSVLAAPLSAKELYLSSTPGTIVIDPQGRVAELNLERSFGDEVDSALQERLGAWRFEPIVEDGRPVTAQAHLTLELSAQPANGGLKIGVHDVTFHDPPAQRHVREEEIVLPQYPNAPLRKQLGATLDVLVEVGADGQPTRAGMKQGWLYGRTASIAHSDVHLQRFAKASVAAVMKWAFQPASDGQPYWVTVPVSFHAQPQQVWQRAHAVAHTPEPWILLHASEAQAYAADGAQADLRVRLLSSLDALPEAERG